MNRHILTRSFTLVRGSSLGMNIKTAALCSLMICSLFAPARLPAQDNARLQEGPWNAILLKNDRVLLGKVERRGELYVVEVANQSAVSLPTAQVDFVGRSIGDIYTYKIRCVSRWNIGEHFQLTRWCMVNNLIDEATLHYGEVAKQAGDHPRVKQLAIELKHQMLKDQEFRTYLGLGPVAEPNSASSTAEANTASSPVAVASATMRIVQHPQVVQQFSERVQPILINRCSQAACHGSLSSNRLKMLEPYSRTSLDTSSKNLASVLEHISQTSDTVSPLMVYATKSHGLQRRPGIALTETELVEELRTWILFVQNPVVSANASVATSPSKIGLRENATPGGIPSSLTPVPPGAAQLRQVPKPAVAGFPLGEAVPSDSELDDLEAEINKLLGPPNSNDPFDPAEFNRQTSAGK